MTLGRLDTISRENCLIAEDTVYGILIPIIDEDSSLWEEITDESPHPFGRKEEN